MIRTNFVPVVVLMLSALIFASQSPQRGAQPGQTATPNQPVKAKKILVRELPREIEGIVLDNGVFKIKPGYKFVPQANNRIAVGALPGGGVSGSFDCFCSKEEGGGSCSVTTVGSTISCSKDKTKPCEEGCILRTTVGGSKFKLAIY